MFWLDEIVDDILAKYPEKGTASRPFIARDEKTVSGRVHVGSIRGVAIHALIMQALRERGKKAKFIFELNDTDPMDGLPVYLSKKFQKYMGKPLKDVPQPDEKGEPDIASFQKDPDKNFGRYFGNEFIEVINKLGFETEFVWGSDFYEKGFYDPWIQKVIEHPDEIRKTYKEISGSEKEKGWYPLQVVCEKCGRVGTTQVYAFDGKEVSYECRPDLVEWADGCGYSGKVIPKGLRAKLPWKVEWPVKWNALHVDIEGSGKDHNASGGSHEIGEYIAKKVLEGFVPYNIPYEFFLFGGKKMSASKAAGVTAKEISEMLHPELLRMLMVRARPKRQIEFDPSGDTIPRLYDYHDEAAEAFFGKETAENQDLRRIYHFSRLHSGKPKKVFLPRFSRVAFILQIPSLDFEEEIGKLKGSLLTKEDKKEAEERKKYAETWLEKYASGNAKFTVQKKLPEMVKNLSEDQRKFLHDLAALLESKKDWQGEELHAALHDLRKKSPLQPREGFGAIYAALLGKESGPQAGWFLEALDRDFAIRRFKEV